MHLIIQTRYTGIFYNKKTLIFNMGLIRIDKAIRNSLQTRDLVSRCTYQDVKIRENRLSAI